MARRSGRFKAVDEDADEHMDVEGMLVEDDFFFLSSILIVEWDADDPVKVNDTEERGEEGELAYTSAVSMAQADDQVLLMRWMMKKSEKGLVLPELMGTTKVYQLSPSP